MTSMARETIVQSLPSELIGTKFKLEIKACNLTHYAFRYGPAGSESKMQILGYGVAQDVSYGFTGMWFHSFVSVHVSGKFGTFFSIGTMLGIFATANGGNGTTPAYFSEWTYHGGYQYIDWTCMLEVVRFSVSLLFLLSVGHALFRPIERSTTYSSRNKSLKIVTKLCLALNCQLLTWCEVVRCL